MGVHVLLVKVNYFKVISKLHLNGCMSLPEYGLGPFQRGVASDGNVCIHKLSLGN